MYLRPLIQNVSSFTRLNVFSITRLNVSSFTCFNFLHLLIQNVSLFTRLNMHSFTHSKLIFVYSFKCVFIYSFKCILVYLLKCIFVYSFKMCLYLLYMTVFGKVSLEMPLCWEYCFNQTNNHKIFIRFLPYFYITKNTCSTINFLVLQVLLEWAFCK